MDIIYITRKKDLFDHTAAHEITLPEWTAFVANDPDMRLDNYTIVTLPNGEQYRYTSPGTATWLSRERGQSEVREMIFDYVAGDIVIKKPGDKAMEKIRHIAYKLNAQIFLETQTSIAQIPVKPWVVKPRFRFSDALIPFKRSIPRLLTFLQQYAFSFFRSHAEKQRVRES